MSNALPVRQIFLASIGLSLERYRDIARLAWPYMMMVLLEPILEESVAGTMEFLVWYLLVLGTSVLAIVGCHRIFLLNTSQVNETDTFRWGTRESRFVIAGIGIAFLWYLLSLPLLIPILNMGIFDALFEAEHTVLAMTVTMIASLPATYFLCRWSLVFPALAVDADVTIRWAWRLTRGHGLEIFLLLGVLPLFTSSAADIIQYLLPGSIISDTLFSLVWIVISIVEVCLLSLTYRWLTEHSAEEDRPV